MYARINGGTAYRLGINVGPSCMSRIKGGHTSKVAAHEDQRWTHVCRRSTVAAHNCEDQQWLCMYVGNQLWLRMYVWGSTVATNVC